MTAPVMRLRDVLWLPYRDFIAWYWLARLMVATMDLHDAVLAQSEATARLGEATARLGEAMEGHRGTR